MFDPPIPIPALPPDLWPRLQSINRGLLGASTLRQFAREATEGIVRELGAAVAQVWWRGGEMEQASIAIHYHADHLELGAQSQREPLAEPPRRVRLRDSLAGFVATEQVVHLWRATSDSGNEWDDCAWASRCGLHSAIAAPLTYLDRTLGSIVVWMPENEASLFEKAMRAVAENASLVLAQILRLKLSERQMQWLAALQQVTGLLSVHVAPDELYRLISEGIARILSVDRFSINLFDEHSDQMQAVVSMELREGRPLYLAPEPPRPVTGTVWERVLHTFEPILLNRSPGFSARAGEQGGPGAEATPAPLAASVMYAPMMVRDHCVGVMAAHSLTPMAYDQQSLDLLASVANQSGLAIENALLVDRLNRQIVETRKANRLKSQFVANISHEVRTPLNAILGFTRIVRRRADNSLPPQQLQNLDYVLESADHLLGLINELLDLSRLEAGRIELCPEPVDLWRLVARVVAELEPAAQESGNRIEVQLSQGEPAVCSDPVRLRQILMNLLSNALKFTRGGVIHVSGGGTEDTQPTEPGWVVIQIPPESESGTNTPVPIVTIPSPSAVRTPAPRKVFYLQVADTGQGIQHAQVGEIFEEFRQESAGDSRSRGGAGLGLSIVRRLTALMDGVIWVRTLPGQGSTFRVILSELSVQ